MIEIYSHLHERSNQSPQIVNPQELLMSTHRTELHLTRQTDNRMVSFVLKQTLKISNDSQLHCLTVSPIIVTARWEHIINWPSASRNRPGADASRAHVYIPGTE